MLSYHRLCFFATLLLCGTALGQEPKSYLYVESNVGSVPSQNAVYGFANDGLGNLTPLPGSPYSTGGTGVTVAGSSELDADQQVTATAAGNALYAVNGHSNTIAGFAVNADGTLTTLPGSPYASEGQDPVSIGVSGGFLVVANKNLDPGQDIDGDVPNYTTFTVRRDGSLRLNAGSTLDLPAASGPSQALVVGSSRLVFGLELFTSRIACYSYAKNGLLTELSSIAPTTPDGAFLGEFMHPKKRVLYAGLLKTNELGVYRVDASGVLSFVRAVANSGVDICWLRMNADGTRLYSSESVSKTLTVYDTTNALAPVELQHIQLNATDGFGVNIELDPSGAFLYALAGHGIHILSIDANGLLSETVAPVVLPTPNRDSPLGLAIIRK